MFGRRFPVFRLFGFQVWIDLSWLVIAALVTWSLAVGFFPTRVEGLAPSTYWVMGIAGAAGLFFSIVIHEFAHSLVARRYGLPMKGITLFIFGGVAEMSEEPQRPKVEFMVAIAGPVSSILLALGLYGVATLGAGAWPAPVGGVLEYLVWINALLVAFNMVPAFPLDGGRVARSALWAWKRDLRRATRVVTTIGSGFGLLLLGLGVVAVLFGNFIGGMWWFLIGMFLRSAAEASYQRLVLRQALQGETVRRFMREDPVTVAPWTSVEQFVDDYLYRHHHKMFPVSDNGTLAGCVTLDRVKEVPREQWGSRDVASVMDMCSDENTIAADTDAVQALHRMNRTQKSRLMVIDRDRLVGVLSLRDLLRFLAFKVELDEKA